MAFDPIQTSLYAELVHIVGADPILKIFEPYFPALKLKASD